MRKEAEIGYITLNGNNEILKEEILKELVVSQNARKK